MTEIHDDGGWLDWSEIEARRDAQPTRAARPEGVTARSGVEEPARLADRSTSPPPAGYDGSGALPLPGAEPLGRLEGRPGIRGGAIADGEGALDRRGTLTEEIAGACDYLAAIGDGIGELLGVGTLRDLELRGVERQLLVHRPRAGGTVYLDLEEHADVEAVRRELERP